MFRFTDLIIFRFTRDCNLNCSYCFMTNKGDFKGEMISHEIFVKIVDEIVKERIINRPNHKLDFVFHGGEALMIGKERFYQAAEYVRFAMNKANINLNLSMQTNGVLLDDEYTKIINKFHIHVGMSFDGISNANKERNVKQEVFEKKFDLLENNKVDYGLLVVAGKNNIDKIGKTRKYLENKNIGYKVNYAEDMFTPGLNSPIEVDGKEFFKKVYEPELKRFLKTGNSYDSQMITFLDRTIIDLFSFYIDNEHTGCGKLFCGSCIGMIGVNPDGTSHYCDRYNKEYEDTFVMNVLDYDFLGLNQLKRATDFNLIRHNVVKETGCDTCYARNICEGGCMAFYRSKYGVNGIDKRLVCGLFKTFYSYVLNNIEDFMKAFVKHGKVFESSHKFIEMKNDMLNLAKKNGIEVQYDTSKKDVYFIRFIKDEK